MIKNYIEEFLDTLHQDFWSKILKIVFLVGNHSLYLSISHLVLIKLNHKPKVCDAFLTAFGGRDPVG